MTVETQLAASETLQATSLQQNELGAKFGYYSKTSQGRKETQVFVAQAQPL